MYFCSLFLLPKVDSRADSAFGFGDPVQHLCDGVILTCSSGDLVLFEHLLAIISKSQKQAELIQVRKPSGRFKSSREPLDSLDICEHWFRSLYNGPSLGGAMLLPCSMC